MVSSLNPDLPHFYCNMITVTCILSNHTAYLSFFSYLFRHLVVKSSIPVYCQICRTYLYARVSKAIMSYSCKYHKLNILEVYLNFMFRNFYSYVHMINITAWGCKYKTLCRLNGTTSPLTKELILCHSFLLIPLSLQPNAKDLRFFKLWTQLHQNI